MEIQYSNKFIQNNLVGDPKAFVYQLIYDKNDSDNTNIIQYLLLMDYYYASSWIVLWHIFSMNSQ